jgi:hypothetical protein
MMVMTVFAIYASHGSDPEGKGISDTVCGTEACMYESNTKRRSTCRLDERLRYRRDQRETSLPLAGLVSLWCKVASPESLQAPGYPPL